MPLFGCQLPLVQGISFAAVSTLTTIIGNAGGGTDGLRTALGPVIVAALVGLVISPFFSRVVKFFPPVVTGSITVIGLSLMPVAAGWIAGQRTIFVDGAPTPNPAYGDVGAIGVAAVSRCFVPSPRSAVDRCRLAALPGDSY